MRANLLRALSHDLRTPLTSISGSITTVLDEGEALSPTMKQELLIGAKRDAEWLYRMVENLLSVTRISGENSSLIKSDELLEEVLSEAVQRFRKRPDAVPISVAVPDRAELLPMDDMLIEQVLMNLMDNAVTHGGTVTQIWIEATVADSFVTISVRDNGRGIPKALLPHLFDGSLPLSGGSRSDGSRFMGIVLSVCKTIVEAHGGRIWAENAPDGGAVIRFTLPTGGAGT
jgi:two-component system sensor histidine kinase KdpD